jgi:cobyrinic acid a,c-diamide synthase
VKSLSRPKRSKTARDIGLRSGLADFIIPATNYGNRRLPQVQAKRKEETIKGIVIAGTHSGCGKTTVSLGLMAAMVARGLRVAPFKVGPDFIDPGHHARAAQTASRNLDGWMLPREYNHRTFRHAAAVADIAVVEGVMGLFDGYDGSTEAGSTAQMAKWLALPVVLVVDARSMARSAAALVQGFENFDPQVQFAGVVFNNLGSFRHLEYLRQALSGAVKMPCLGGLLRNDAIAIPERHLGLVTREDHPLGDEHLRQLAQIIDQCLDVERLLKDLAARDAAHPQPEPTQAVPAVRIGLARDPAFCFYYQDNLEMLEAHGAQLIPFSPVADESLPLDLDGLYLGGGYPELHAEALSGNAAMRAQIRQSSACGMPIYAECGGFMYLCNRLVDHAGRGFRMAGCFPFATRMLPKLRALGYREIRLTRDTVIGRQGLSLRGHEFHYSELVPETVSCGTAYRISGRGGEQRPDEGYWVGRTLGSYIHLHFGSEPRAAQHFIDSCRAYREERNRTP